MSGTSGTVTVPGPAGPQGVAGPAGPQGPAGPAGPRIERRTAVTDGSGNATFAWAPAFTAPPVVAVGLQAGAGFYSHRITANTAAATTVNVLAAAGVTLLGIGVLAAGAPAAGVTVHAHAVES